MEKIAVFAAGRGSNFEQLCRAAKDNRLKASIALLVVSKPDCGALDIARAFEIPAVVFKKIDFTSDDSYCDAIIEKLNAHHIAYIALAGWLQLIHPRLIQNFPNRILNIHPALLPFFGGKGMYGQHVHKAVWESGMRVSGATVHLVNKDYDKGLILAQKSVTLAYGDGPEEIAQKVLRAEHSLYAETLQHWISGTLYMENNRIQKSN